MIAIILGAVAPCSSRGARRMVERGVGGCRAPGPRPRRPCSSRCRASPGTPAYPPSRSSHADTSSRYSLAPCDSPFFSEHGWTTTRIGYSVGVQPHHAGVFQRKTTALGQCDNTDRGPRPDLLRRSSRAPYPAQIAPSAPDDVQVVPSSIPCPRSALIRDRTWHPAPGVPGLRARPGP